MGTLSIEVDERYTQEINDYIRYFGVGEYMFDNGYDIYCEDARMQGGNCVDVIAVKKIYVRNIGAMGAIQIINGRLTINKKSGKLKLIEQELKRINKNIPFVQVEREAKLTEDREAGVIFTDTINLKIRVPEDNDTLPTYLICQVFGYDPIKHRPI